MASTAPLVGGSVVEELGSSTGFLLALLGQETMRRLRDALTAHDLKPRQFQILDLLVDRGPIGQRELGDLMTIHHRILVTMLNPLEADGLIERKRSGTDRRRHDVSVTPAGKRRLVSAARAQREAEDVLFAGLTEQQRDQFRELLTALRETIDTESPTATAQSSAAEAEPLGRRVAAVHTHRRTGDVRRLVGEKPNACGGYLRRVRETPDRVLRDRRVDLGRVATQQIFEEVIHHRRLRVRRADRVYADSLCRELERGGSGEADDAVFCGHIAGCSGPPDNPGGRGHVEDRAGSLPGHHPELVLRAEEDAVQVGVEDTAPSLVVRVRGERDGAEDAGAVECAVEGPQFAERLSDDRLDGFLASDVACTEDRLAAVAADLGAEGLAAVDIDVRQEQPCSLAVGLERCSPADAAGSSGDEHDFAVEDPHHAPFTTLG